jgi:hypothetical protein
MTSLTASVLEETTQVIDMTFVNVAADISKVALILSVFEEHERDDRATEPLMQKVGA